MTVSELIELLKQYPADLPVVVGGFDEWGFDNIGEPEVLEIAPVPPASHGPDYESVESAKHPTGPAFNALYLDRRP